MRLREWSKHELGYGRRLVNTGVDGALSGQREYLHGEPMTPVLCESARNAISFAAAGTCLGLLGGRHKSAGKALALGIVGGAVGFGVGMAWGTRRLGASVASAAWKNIGRARDEHWLEKHPIDYA